MNVLARISFTLDIPESLVEKSMNGPDDGSDQYRSDALTLWEIRLRDEFGEYMDHMTGGEADVDVDG